MAALQQWLLIGVTLVIALATAAAVFQDQIRSWLWKPALVVLSVSSKEDCHKTSGIDVTGEQRPCYYYRLRVHNNGKVAARDVEVFAKELKRADGSGKWVSVARFIPQWLNWAVLRHRDPLKGIYLPTIPPNASRHFDLAHVIQPVYRERFPFEQDPEAPPDQTLISLDVAVNYQRLGHLLLPGRYLLTLELAGSNVKPVECVVEIQNSGPWHDDEDNMLAHGVSILRVQMKT